MRRIKTIVPVPVPPEALDAFAVEISEPLRRPDNDLVFSCAEQGGATLDSYYEGTVADAFCRKAGLTAEEDAAGVLVLGSTMMHQTHRFLEREMPAPVLNPGLMAFETCEMLLELVLSQSSAAYEEPEQRNDAALGGQRVNIRADELEVSSC